MLLFLFRGCFCFATGAISGEFVETKWQCVYVCLLQAALTALRALSEMGLDSVAPSGSGMKKDGQPGTQGDG